MQFGSLSKNYTGATSATGAHDYATDSNSQIQSCQISKADIPLRPRRLSFFSDRRSRKAILVIIILIIVFVLLMVLAKVNSKKRRSGN